jgi:hypothetical protein
MVAGRFLKKCIQIYLSGNYYANPNNCIPISDQRGVGGYMIEVGLGQSVRDNKSSLSCLPAAELLSSLYHRYYSARSLQQSLITGALS